MSEYYYNKDYFKIINNEHKAYWLGFLYADGYVEPIYRKDKIKAFRLELSLQESDEDMLLLFKKDIDDFLLQVKEKLLKDIQNEVK